MGLLIGGVYRVKGMLGSGAMGVVFLAEDETLERKVAVKFIRSALIDDAFRKRFRAEAQAMARVNHPNTLQIHAFGEHDGAPYFVMEFVDGVTLDQWMARNGGPPGLDRALSILEQACSGVAAIHAADTVHRDLKPSNILIDAAERAWVTDLGLATLHRDEPTKAHEIVGTPAYMAPEVASPEDVEEARSGERADVYSLGCIAYELLTGMPPFSADGHIAMMFHHAVTVPVAPSLRRAGLPSLLDSVILAALAKRPADRTPTVDAFRAALRSVREGVAEPTRILVAEDDDDLRSTLEVALGSAFPSARLDCVPNGRQALEAFDRNRPSIAILDLVMPEMNGLELTGLLRARDPEASVPIIVLTASGGGAEWKRLSAMGADRFLVKPIMLDELVPMVRRLLRERFASTPPPALARAPVSATPPPVP